MEHRLPLMSSHSREPSDNGQRSSSGYDVSGTRHGLLNDSSQKRARTAEPASRDERPVLEEQDWTGLWSQMLHSDNDTNIALDTDAATEENIKSSLSAIQDDIETWAEVHWAPSSSYQNTATEKVEQSIETTSQAGDPANSKPLCFGTVKSVAIKLIGDMSELQKKLESYPATLGCYAFKVGKSKEYYAIRLSDDADLGMINAQTAIALDTICCEPSVYLEAFAVARNCQSVLLRAQKSSEANLTVDIHVCGSPNVRSIVGDRLSAKKVYLQHIKHQAEKYHYDNPQYISFPGIEVVAMPEITGQSSGLARVSLEPKLQEVFAGICDTSQRDSSLKRVEKDIRIKTSLLEHQQKALDFMLQREYGPVPPTFCLWRSDDSGEQNGYKHSITGAICSSPPSETGGGILADEMGMGKSLTLLSYVAKTLDHSHMSAQLGNLRDGDMVNETMYSRSTVIVVPSMLVLNEWLLEINKHLDGTLRVIKYHGHRREIRTTKLADSDIVLTTYHTLAADVASNKNTLQQINWYRIVLDEAHIIRRQSTNLYAAVASLSAKHRWCLTGTPIHNCLEDIGSLLAFIGAVPFDNPMVFRKHIVLPFERDVQTATKRLQLLLDSFCLRRPSTLLNLPEILEIRHELSLAPEEKRQYEITLRLMDQVIRRQAGDASGKLNPFGLFQAQLQLRILCNHGTFQKQFSWSRPRDFLLEREAAVATIGAEREVRCSQCKETTLVLSTTRPQMDLRQCGHVFCPECAFQHAGLGEKIGTLLHCQLCQAADSKMGQSCIYKQPVRHSETNPALEGHDHFNRSGFSTKMTAIMADLEEDQFKSKSIVFSCWTRSLDLIALHLRHSGVRFARIDGNCELNRRQEMIRSFSTDQNVPVLIMTTGTGAYGLNLAVASRVFIVEPQWNPSVESQAIGRASRLGQKVPVTVFRYFTKDTVEEEMRAQQGRKTNLAKIGWQCS